MIKDILKQLGAFVFYLLLQVLVVNNIQIAWFVNPLVYVGFIILLPVDTPKWLLLLAAFVMGYMVDVFVSTPGMHTSALLMMAFIRPYLHNVMVPRDDFQPATIPNVSTFGLPWFIRYIIVMVAIHHFMLFLVEAFSIALFHITLLKTLASGILTILILLLIQLFTFGKTKNA